MKSEPRGGSRGPLKRILGTRRTEGASRAREAWAIGLGMFVGCSPFLGLRFALCLAAGWIFRLNRLKLYLAAKLINPLILPGILLAHVQLGSWLRRGRGYPLSLDAFSSMDPWHVGADLLVGSVIIGGVIGALFGVVTFVSLGRAYPDPEFARLVRDAGDRYLGSSMTAWGFARAKLRNDPVYRAVLMSGLVPASGRLVDVGCGQGLLLALLAQARVAARERTWPGGWSQPPSDLELAGIELRDHVADLARHALGDDASILTADALDVAVEGADIVVLLDLLQLLDAPSQEALVMRLAKALPPGGRVLVREADASAGWGFQAVRLGNLVTALAQRRWRARLAFRSATEWRALLERHGLEVRLALMGEGTPFANVLLVGEKRSGGRLADGDRYGGRPAVVD